MSKINTLVSAPDSRLIDSKDLKIGTKTKHRYWLMTLSILLMPAMIQQAEARKPKQSNYCIESGCKGDKCIFCQR